MSRETVVLTVGFLRSSNADNFADLVKFSNSSMDERQDTTKRVDHTTMQAADSKMEVLGKGPKLLNHIEIDHLKPLLEV